MRLLLIEDESSLAAAIARGLRAEGMDVDVVHDGLDGLWRAREGRYSVIILDILLPGMNGYEVCRTLRAEGVSTPILVLTAKDGEYDEADGLDVGADDYLRKPFSFVVLVARLRALARRPREQRPDVLQSGDLMLDPTTRECYRAGTAISLTPREGALLEALLRASPDPVPKRHLVDDVWGYDFEGDPNVVEVYVGYLRAKIDRPFARTSLQTVRGVGYRVLDDARVLS